MGQNYCVITRISILSDVIDMKPPISKHLLGEHLVAELCGEQQLKSCELDVLCSAIDVSCAGDEQTKTDSVVDQSRMNIVTEAEWSEPSTTNDLGAETIATHSCKQCAMDHFAEVEGDDADKQEVLLLYYIAVYPMEFPHNMDWTSIM